jgi:hypothetical protein
VNLGNDEAEGTQFLAVLTAMKPGLIGERVQHGRRTGDE